jgi:DNA-binding MarR family transcriptional regulator
LRSGGLPGSLISKGSQSAWPEPGIRRIGVPFDEFQAMFFLEELPDPEILNGFASRFSEMEVDSTTACLKLLWLASHLFRDLETHFTNHGLSLARFLALIILERTPKKQLMPVEMAKQLGISKKNTARVLSFMEKDDLVRRTSHKSDRRASIVAITAKGSTLLSEAMPGYYRVLNRTMKPLDADAKVVLIDLLTRLSREGRWDTRRTTLSED